MFNIFQYFSTFFNIHFLNVLFFAKKKTAQTAQKSGDHRDRLHRGRATHLGRAGWSAPWNKKPVGLFGFVQKTGLKMAEVIMI